MLSVEDFGEGLFLLYVAWESAYPCSNELEAWIQSIPSPTHEACLVSIDEMKLSDLLPFVSEETTTLSRLELRVCFFVRDQIELRFQMHQ